MKFVLNQFAYLIEQCLMNKKQRTFYIYKSYINPVHKTKFLGGTYLLVIPRIRFLID